MGNESGTWVMYGVDWDDPECIHTVEEAMEHIYGYDHVTSCYKEEPGTSWNRIVEYMHETYPIATDRQIRKLLR